MIPFVTLGFSHQELSCRPITEWDALIAMLALRLHKAFVLFAQDGVEGGSLEMWLRWFECELVRLFL